MTIDELITALAQYPGDLDVAMCIVGQEGITYDPIVARVEHAVQLDPDQRIVWVTGSETSDAPPATVSTGCHCGIEHDVNTDGLVCELPTRAS